MFRVREGPSPRLLRTKVNGEKLGVGKTKKLIDSINRLAIIPNIEITPFLKTS